MKKIAMVNMKGGVAKTTLAVNLAHALWKREDKRVLLIDLDPQFNATQCLLSGDEYVEARKKGRHTILNIFDDAPTTSISPVIDSLAAAYDDLCKFVHSATPAHMTFASIYGHVFAYTESDFVACAETQKKICFDANCILFWLRQSVLLKMERMHSDYIRDNLPKELKRAATDR